MKFSRESLRNVALFCKLLTLSTDVDVHGTTMAQLLLKFYILIQYVL